MAEHALSPHARPAVRQAFLAATAPTTPAMATADFEMVRATDLSERLADVTCPIIWLDGADDAIVPPALHDGRRGDVVTVPAAGHLLPIEAPAAVAETIAAILG